MSDSALITVYLAGVTLILLGGGVYWRVKEPYEGWKGFLLTVPVAAGWPIMLPLLGFGWAIWTLSYAIAARIRA